MALSTWVPGFLGTNPFSLTSKGTHYFCPKSKKSATGNPSNENDDKTPEFNWGPPLTKMLFSSAASIMHHTEMSAHKF